MKHLTVSIGLLLLIAGCSGRSPSVGPSPSGTTGTLSAQDLTGTWSGTYSITGVLGGGCVGDEYYQRLIGPPLAFVLAVSQTGTALNASAVDPGTTLSSSYTGTVGTTPPIPLYSADPNPTVIPFTCVSSAAYDVRFASGLINWTLTGDRSATGTITANYNVYASGTQTNTGTMIVTANFTVAR
jgi:hypothetical protein